MPKNTTGGKKHKKAKNYVKVEKLIESDNEFQFYAKVNQKLGGGNFSVDVFIPEKREKVKAEIRLELPKALNSETSKGLDGYNLVLWILFPMLRNMSALNRPCAIRWKTARWNAPRPHSIIIYPIWPIVE